MEVILRLENLETSVKHTRSNTSQSLCTIRDLTNRLRDLWILWRELWKKLGLHQLKEPPNNFFKYIGLHLITKHQPHNLQPMWCLHVGYMLYFDLRPDPKILFQGNTPEGSDTFQRPVIERDRVGGLRLMIWDKVKVPLCHYSHAPEESNLWTAWQLFPLDDD